jgi:Zn finger protein HypA/HybF involved in hydrogenase expression
MRDQKIVTILTISGALSLVLGLILFIVQPVGLVDFNPEDINYVLLGFSFGFAIIGIIILLVALVMYRSLAKPGHVRSFKAPSSSPEERKLAEERYKERIEEALKIALGKQKEITPNEIIAAVETTTYTKDDFCMVCKLSFKREKDILQCPICESLYHKEHLLDWIRTHKNCPVCSQSLYEIKS